MEEVQKSIAHQIGGVQNDALRFGLQGVKSDIVGSHPLQSAQESANRINEAMKKQCLVNLYGTAFPLKMDLDRQILSRFQRPPGVIPSSMLGLEAYTGSLDDFGFEDYLNDPRESETLRPLDMHHGMEVRLGLSKGPVCPSFITLAQTPHPQKRSMVKWKLVAVCSVVAILGLLSAATAFAAEATRIRASQVQFVTAVQCEYPRTPALPLGLTSVLALIIAQIILTVANGFTFVIAFLLLLTGAALNDQHGEESMYFGNYYCYVVKPGVFSAAAILSLVSIASGIAYYLTLTTGKSVGSPWGNSSYPNQGGIAMGQPQFPPQTSQDPVFVHEDTYSTQLIPRKVVTDS
ncbi:hypothetical protein Ahy_B05g078770 isoform A [Arachis hypogaea]|uniref:Uncharacterized protein n=1 Tax=Arachis hypogaea TaxID=3818 RepID=A0A444Z7Z9_ARAHY|nr:hypothetical protein Ahy_B05g078770 isoform A [Arachis hypogaea]